MNKALTTATTWGRLLDLGIESLIVWVAVLAVIAPVLCIGGAILAWLAQRR